MSLGRQLVKDGEGATKFVEIMVQNAADHDDARQLAYTIAHSQLVKTALFASDANWGRILAAIGRAKLSRLDIERVKLYLGDVCLINNGLPDANYSEDQGQAEMALDQPLREQLQLAAQQRLPSLGEAGPAPLQAQQGNPQLLLQPRHRIANRRLAAVQVSGGLGETTLLHHRLQYRPVFQIEPRDHH